MTQLFKMLFAAAMLLCSMTTIAQSNTEAIEFQYDLAGNRIMRQVIILEKKSMMDDDAELTGDPSKSYNNQVNYGEVIGQIKVSIFPNPNGGQFRVEIHNAENEINGKLYLHTLDGNLIYQEDHLGINTEIDISTRQNGAYILSVIINGEKKTWKIIKQ